MVRERLLCASCLDWIGQSSILGSLSDPCLLPHVAFPLSDCACAKISLAYKALAILALGPPEWFQLILITSAVTWFQSDIRMNVEGIQLVLKSSPSITLPCCTPGSLPYDSQIQAYRFKINKSWWNALDMCHTTNWSLWPRTEKDREKEDFVRAQFLFEAKAPYLPNPRLVLKSLEFTQVFIF